MPTLNWIGKDKVLNHHLEVPFHVLERQYSFDEAGKHEEDNGSENMIFMGTICWRSNRCCPSMKARLNVFILIRRTIQVKKTGCTMIMLTMNK